MRRLLLLLRRSLAASALVVVCVSEAGCSTPTESPSPGGVDDLKLLEWWKPHLLYLLSSPHPRLYVEIDAVEGCEPESVSLEKIREFLSACIKKPQGIDIVRSDVIPTDAARRFSEKALARRYINGPGKTNTSSTAFMYLLFYDDALHQDALAANVSQTRAREIENPYTDVLSYPAIYFNTRYFPGKGKNEGLLHEVGHLLGLASRPGHAPGRHCMARTCLMNTTYRMRHRAFGLQQKSCRECEAELARSLTETSMPNVRYIGAVLARSEADYHVLTLPDRVAIVAGELADRDCEGFAVATRSDASGSRDGEIRIHCLVRDDILNDSARLTQILHQVKADRFDPVRQEGAKVFLKTCARRYNDLRQYTNAIDALDRAIQLDAKDDWSYNQLAWIRATCSDASVRNGTEAVLAAKEACELTEWKKWRPIDTLAAAYAEAGDFKRAIEMQERALATGDLPQPEQKLMRERLSLYRKAEPFRQN